MKCDIFEVLFSISFDLLIFSAYDIQLIIILGHIFIFFYLCYSYIVMFCVNSYFVLFVITVIAWNVKPWVLHAF